MIITIIYIYIFFLYIFYFLCSYIYKFILLSLVIVHPSKQNNFFKMKPKELSCSEKLKGLIY